MVVYNPFFVERAKVEGTGDITQYPFTDIKLPGVPYHFYTMIV